MAREFVSLFTIDISKMDEFEEVIKTKTKADEVAFTPSLEVGSINATVAFNTFVERDQGQKALTKFGRAQVRF